MKILRLIMVAAATFFYAYSALAQSSGAVTNHAFALGKGIGSTGYTSLLCGSAQLAVGQAAADPICQTITGDGSLSAGGALTVTKTGGVSFAPSATTDTTNAANITSGVLATARLTNAQLAVFTPTNASPAAETIQGKLQQAPVMCEDYSGGCTAANIQQAMTDAASSQRCFQFNGTYTVTTTVSLSGISSNLCLIGRGGLRGPASGTLSAVLEIKNFTGMTVDGNITIDCNANAFIGAGLKIWSSGVGLSVQNQSIRFSEYANCRQAIQIGDPTQSTLPISEINIPTGFFFNVAQGVRVWSSNAVVTVQGLISSVDPHSSGNWALSATGTCTSTTITLSAPSANSYFDQYDIITGTGIQANTYITGQQSGTLGGAGVYNLSTSGNTCSSAAVSGEKRGINYWTSGGSINVSGAETVNTVVNNGLLCITDVMAGPNIYGNCSFTGGVLEVGGQMAASFNPTAIASPTAGVISFVSNRGFVGGLTTTNMIATDSTYVGSVVISANHQLFATSPRTGLNVVASNSGATIYYDLSSFGANMVKGASGISGGTQYASSVANAATTVQAAPSNPTGTTSGAGVMMGMGGTCKITPASTGRIQVSFVGAHADTAASFTHTMNVRYGTGTAPANGAALTGTVIMGNNNVTTNINASTGNVLGFNLGGVVNGLTIGTAYWLDMNLGTGSGGTGSISGINCTAVEF